MAVRVTPADRLTSVGQHAGMERSIAISRPLTGSDRLYSSIVSTAPGDKTRVHHHGDCETSIYILSGVAGYTYGPTGTEHAFDAEAGDFIYIPAGEIHVEVNASDTEPLVVVLTRNCPDSHVVYLDGGPDGADDVPASVLSGWRDRTLAELLDAHGLGLAMERPFPTDGWSGATFSTLEADGRRFVLKRTSAAIDWIAEATDDGDLREAWLAAARGRGPADQPSSGFDAMLPMAALGAARDDASGGAAILLPDLSTELIAWERPGHDPAVDEATLGRVLRGMARLHAQPWSRVLEDDAARAGVTVPWTPLAPRLTLLTRLSASGYAAAGNPVGERFLVGWDAFDRVAPAAARTLIDGLTTDPTPLVAALARLPWVGLHGDLKLANVALVGADAITCIDWQMSLRAPVAVELGWFLVSNSGSLPVPPEAVAAAYHEALAWDAGRWGYGAEPHDLTGLAGDWPTQLDLTWIVGLLLRGWRKGLDAEAEVVLPSGVSAADDLAWWAARAVEAADRRL